MYPIYFGSISDSKHSILCIAVSVHCAHLFVDSIASSGHTPINKIRGHPETGETVSGMKC